MGEIGQKRVFPKVIVDHWGCTNKCFEPIEPMEPCQIEVMNQKLTGGALPNLRSFGPKTAFFRPK